MFRDILNLSLLPPLARMETVVRLVFEGNTCASLWPVSFLSSGLRAGLSSADGGRRAEGHASIRFGTNEFKAENGVDNEPRVESSRYQS